MTVKIQLFFLLFAFHLLPVSHRDWVGAMICTVLIAFPYMYQQILRRKAQMSKSREMTAQLPP